MNYKDTINLPHTGFQMRAKLPEMEPEILKFWEEIDIYQELKKACRGREKYILHDGPPYANEQLHIGIALNKILKDIIVKYKTMMGKDAPFIPGWDCHGMPIEHKVMEDLGQKSIKMSRLDIMKICREYASRFVSIQKEDFKRMGIFGDWDNPYLTMNKEYEAKIVETFGKIVGKGYVYRGLRPIHWCLHCRTALAEAEVEYKDAESPSIYVKFPIKEPIPGIKQSTSFIIWTTTPWTLPANVALAVHPTYQYSFVAVDDEVYIIAKDLVANIMQAIGNSARGGCALGTKDYKVVKSVSGSELENLHCSHPLVKRDSVVILADFVTLEQGTGIVHIAPGHGYEDYQVGIKYRLPVISPVDEHGKFTDEVKEFQGKQVFDADSEIIKLLAKKGVLLRETRVTHSYPHCWRCRKPLIFRATEQWFLNVDHNQLRERCLNEIEKVKWVPAWSEERIKNMVQERPDWCLSRQRNWGVPIPALYCQSCNYPLLDKDIIDRAQKVIQKGGVEAWFTCDFKELLPPNKTCPKCDANQFEKEVDILDVWFDASSSYNAVVKERAELRYPADLYLEAAEQGRGWFQGSLLASTITEGKSPYRATLSHGLVLDSSFKKMSKSLGNAVSPKEMCEKYGAEILRLQFSSADYTHDFPFGENLFPPVVESYRKIRNTFRFLLGNLYDFKPDKDKVEYNKLLEIDRLTLHLLQKLIQEMTTAYEKFTFYKVCYLFHNFCVVKLSKFYFDILKDRLYTYGKCSLERRSAQTVLYELVHALVRLIAPILPFTAEEVWGKLPPSKHVKSVHLSLILEPNETWLDDKLVIKWQRLITVRDEVLIALEQARNKKLIGNSLEAKVALWTEDTNLRDLLQEYLNELPSLFIVSHVAIERLENMEKIKELEISILKIEEKKCARCWVFSSEVGSDARYPSCCPKCVKALEEDL